MLPMLLSVAVSPEGIPVTAASETLELPSLMLSEAGAASSGT